MELFLDAEKAYSESIRFRKNQEQILHKNMMEHLNRNIMDAVEAGKMSCVNDWSKFSNKDIFDTDLTDTFLKEILQAGYDVEFYYDSPSSYNPCGIVVAWGANREKEIDNVFESIPEIYRGENSGIH